MSATEKCPTRGCVRQNCRSIVHHGAPRQTKCPACGLLASLGETSEIARPGNAQHPGKDAVHGDWRHAVGVTCGSCNHYFLAEDTPASLLDSMEAWERPVANRPHPDLEGMRRRVRERTKAWRQGGAGSQFA
jgi:hypothetical protein